MRSVVERMKGQRVAVLGDPVLDIYLYGSTHRISREAPVLIVKEDDRATFLGGAANTAHNFAAFGAETSLIGLVGTDEAGTELAALATAAKIDPGRLVRRTTGHTITKTRVLAGGLHTRKQQMLRIDRENDRPIDAEETERLVRTVTEAIADLDALVISDYGDESLTDLYVELAARARAADKLVVVDSRYALGKFAGVTAVTPNEPEVEQTFAVRLESDDDARAAAERLVRELSLDYALLTRGSEGMAVAAKDRDTVLLPAHGGQEAVDVTGAGDTVTAAFTLALLAGADVVDAARIANAAASQVVRVMGAATCDPEVLLAELGA
ncbi:MAG: bifunctional ADP-heptose synthase [Deltaproteobacteria bacterium]